VNFLGPRLERNGKLQDPIETALARTNIAYLVRIRVLRPVHLDHRPLRFLVLLPFQLHAAVRRRRPLSRRLGRPLSLSSTRSIPPRPRLACSAHIHMVSLRNPPTPSTSSIESSKLTPRAWVIVPETRSRPACRSTLRVQHPPSSSCPPR
jgi:hypothetical protein